MSARLGTHPSLLRADRLSVDDGKTTCNRRDGRPEVVIGAANNNSARIGSTRYGTEASVGIIDLREDIIAANRVVILPSDDPSPVRQSRNVGCRLGTTCGKWPRLLRDKNLRAEQGPVRIDHLGADFCLNAPEVSPHYDGRGRRLDLQPRGRSETPVRVVLMVNSAVLRVLDESFEAFCAGAAQDVVGIHADRRRRNADGELLA